MSEKMDRNGWLFCLITTSLCLAHLVDAQGAANPQEKNKKFWKNEGKKEKRENLRTENNDAIAKNIILLVGSGLDTTTVNAARIMNGDPSNLLGMERLLTDFGLLRTYGVDKSIAGKAASGTALTCGVKPNDKTLGVNGRVPYQDCALSKSESPLASVLENALDAGKAAGIVTTGRITQGAAAASYATSASDEWEGDVKMPTDSACDDIAYQLVKDTRNKEISVILGGGWKFFYDNQTADPTTAAIDPDQRQDGNNLVNDWISETGGNFVYNARDLQDVADNSKLFGLFSSDVMEYESLRDTSSAEPSLLDMITAAIDNLETDPDGYFLLVEETRIARAHKAGLFGEVYLETVYFNLGLEIILSRVNLSDTLVVVAGDRAQAMSINGYGDRSNWIRGTITPENAENNATDGLPRTTITYMNGPGYSSPREDLTGFNAFANLTFPNPSGVPMTEATDTAADVPVYAAGPLAYLFSGCHEQAYVPKVMEYAACIGDFTGNCDRIIV